MKFGRIPGIEAPVSRVVMGAIQRPCRAAQVVFDEFFESGGNCFDTAWIYGDGACEKILGQWVKSRDIRRQVIILDKGAHTPFCTPKDLTVQFMQSLERLQTDYVDIYMIHRDNPEVPVGEFVDVMDEHRRAGRMRVFGGSNWSLERVEAANEYARSHGAGRLCGGQQQLQPRADGRGAGERMPRLVRRALARVVPPHADAAHLLVEPGVRLFRRAPRSPENRSDPEFARCWYSEDNFQRLARARELAAKRGVQPINIALAYVLCQPFPTFAIIGTSSARAYPRRLAGAGGPTRAGGTAPAEP